VGVTGKFGLIYKPLPWFRFGASYSLPTWFFMTESYSSDLQFAFDTMPSGSYYELNPTLPDLKYRLRTPMKGTLGASFYYKEHGFISVDYDIQNLGSSRYSHFSDPNFNGFDTTLNNYLKATYGYSHTVRVGIEGAIKKLRLRAGYSYTNSPFKKGQNYTDASYDAAVHRASVGLGMRFKSFYFDLAYVLSYSKDGVSPFPNNQIPLDKINSTSLSHSVLLTLGFKIAGKGNKNQPADTQPRKRSSDQLPRYIDPGDKY
jgi:long-subunit fatty acid transport protein